MRTMRLAYRKFGKDLGRDIELKDGTTKRISIFKPESAKRIKTFGKLTTSSDPFKALDST